MLSEKRVIHMTKMALDEEHHARDYMQVVNVTKKDYLSWHGLMAFFVGTLTYVIFYGAVVVVLLSSVFDSITTLLVALLGLLGVIGYLLYLFSYMTSSRRYARGQYEAGKKALRHRVSDWSRLEEIYQEEEENKSPTVSMSDLAQLHQLDIPTEEGAAFASAEDGEESPIVVVEEADSNEEVYVESAMERLQRIKNEQLYANQG